MNSNARMFHLYGFDTCIYRWKWKFSQNDASTSHPVVGRLGVNVRLAVQSGSKMMVVTTEIVSRGC